MQKLIWKKGLFSAKSIILKNGEPVGEIRYNPWKNETIGILFDKKVLFKKHGVFSSNVHIYSLSKEKKELGIIREKGFSSTSFIKQKEGDTIKFSKEGVWKPRYFLKSNRSGEATYKGHEMSGVIEVRGELNESLILGGLYLCNQYSEKALLIIVIITTIIITS